jgi:hypothetical protein
MYYPDKKQFMELAEKGNIIPVYKEISADFDTPLSAFLKIDDKKHSFLFESVEGGETIGRYSFLSSDPSAVIESKGNGLIIMHKGKKTFIENANPLDEISRFMDRFRFVEIDGLPRFCVEKNAVEWAKEVVDLGAGEILLTSMDCDGTKNGYDIELTRSVSEAVTVPVIASGGAGTLEHLYQGLVLGKADAVLAASIFHFKEYTIKQAKEFLREKKVDVRL